MVAELQRIFSNDRQTLGILTAVNSEEKIFVCKTLELAWKDNQPNVSCIPSGTYKCIYTRSNRLSKLKGRDFFTYEILNVAGRAGIRIHAANYFYQLLGCIALGAAHKDINADQQLDVIHSGNTVMEFEKFMNYKEFELIIR